MYTNRQAPFGLGTGRIASIIAPDPKERREMVGLEYPEYVRNNEGANLNTKKEQST